MSPLPLILTAVILLGSGSVLAQDPGLTRAPQCQKLRRLRERLQLLYQFEPHVPDCSPSSLDYLVHDVMRITVVRTLKLAAAQLISRYASSVIVALYPKPLADGTLTARYIGRRGEITRMFTDDLNSVCHAMTVGTGSAKVMNDFLDQNDAHFSASRIECEVGKLQRTYEETLRPVNSSDLRRSEPSRQDATYVPLPDIRC